MSEFLHDMHVFFYHRQGSALASPSIQLQPPKTSPPAPLTHPVIPPPAPSRQAEVPPPAYHSIMIEKPGETDVDVSGALVGEPDEVVDLQTEILPTEQSPRQVFVWEMCFWICIYVNSLSFHSVSFCF